MRISIKDIAEAAGASHSTVSRFQHLSVSLCLLCALCVTDFGIFEKVSGSEAQPMTAGDSITPFSDVEVKGKLVVRESSG